MEKINRFKVLITLYAVLLGYCVLFSTNVLFNVCAVFGGLCVVVLGFAYIEEHMTAKEKTFFNKIVNEMV
jgi:hypothetical protein